jgi:hypothetical protein
MYHLLYQSVNAFTIYGSCAVLTVNSNYFLKQHPFEVWTEFLNIIQTGFGFKGLIVLFYVFQSRSL